MKGQTRLFFFADALFVLTFSICCLIYANHDVLLVILVVAGLVTIYPLYIFVDKVTSEGHNLPVRWYLDYFNMLLWYCLMRFFMLFGFFSWMLIDFSKISVSAVIAHFPPFVIVTLAVLSVAFIILFTLTMYLTPRYRKPVYVYVNMAVDIVEDETKSQFEVASEC